MNVLRYYSTLVLLIGLLIIGCASTAQLPATLNIVPPATDVLPEIAAFSGVWEGKWWGYHECVLVVEKINNDKADVIFSLGLVPGQENSYRYQTAQVSSGSTIEWTEPNGNKYIFKMDKGLNKIHGTFIDNKTGSNAWAYFHRRMVK